MSYGTITTTTLGKFDVVYGHQSKGRWSCTIYNQEGEVVRVGTFGNQKELLSAAKTTLKNIAEGKETANAQRF